MMDFPPEPPQQALISLTESRYGFSLVDLGLTQEDLSLFDSIEILCPLQGNWFCSLETFQEEILPYLEAVSRGTAQSLEAAAQRISLIADKILKASEREVAWFCLRSTLKAPLQKKWHMDSYHYMSGDLQYKFAIALKGSPTLFYLLPTEKKELRKVIWKNMQNVTFTNELCEENLSFAPHREEGIFFILGRPEKAAIHAEPTLPMPRLFFSIVPCKGSDLNSLRNRVEMYYPPSRKEVENF